MSMNRVVRGVGFLLLVLAVSDQGLLAQEPRVRRTVDARGVSRASQVQPIDVGLPLWNIYQKQATMTLREERSGFPEDAVVDVLVQALGLGGAGLSFGTADGRLTIEGSDALTRSAVEMFGVLERRLLAEYEVDVLVVPAEVTPASAVAGPEDFVRWLGDKTTLPASRVTAREGANTRVIAGSSASIVSDYDVMIAQHSVMAVPIMRRLPDALDVSVVIDEAPDGRLLVRLGGHSAVPDGPARIRAFGSAGAQEIELPVMRSTVNFGSAVIASGGGVVLGVNGPGGGRWAIRVRRAGEPVDNRLSPNLRLYPVGALAGVPMLLPAVQIPLGLRSPEFLPEFGLGDAGGGTALMGADVLTEQVGALVEAQQPPAGSSAGAPSVSVHGSWMQVAGPEAFQAAAERALKAAAQTLLRTISLEWRIGRIPAADAASFIAGKTAAADLSTRLERHALTASIPGDGFRLLAGTEEALISGADAEVADGAGIADPIIGTVFSGIAIDGLTELRADGRTSLRCALSVTECPVRPGGRVTGRAREVGPVDSVDLRRVAHRVNTTLEAGKWTAVLIAPAGDEAVVVLVRTAP